MAQSYFVPSWVYMAGHLCLHGKATTTAGPIPVTSYAIAVPSAEVTKRVLVVAVTVGMITVVGAADRASNASAKVRHAGQVFVGSPLQHCALGLVPGTRGRFGEGSCCLGVQAGPLKQVATHAWHER